MKKIIILFILGLTLNLNTLLAQGERIQPTEQQECDGQSGYQSYGAQITARKEPHDACYNGLKVSLKGINSNIIPLQKAEADRKGQVSGSRAATEWGTYAPILVGYQKARMDPLNPANNGTDGATDRKIFEDVPYAVTRSPEWFYYTGSNSKANCPKLLKHKSFDSKKTSEYIINSFDEMSSAASENISGGIGVKGFEFGGNSESQKTIKVTKKTMKRLFIENHIKGKYELTTFARLTEDFLDALTDLLNGNQSQKDFETFMNRWGTHYASAIEIGSAKYALTEITAREVAVGEKNSWGVNAGFANSRKEKTDEQRDGKKVSIEKSVTGFSANIGFGKSNEKLNKTGKETSSMSMVSVGTSSGTAPIRVSLHPIYELCGAVKGPKYQQLKTRFKTAFDKYFKSLDSKDKYKPFITDEEIESFRQEVGRNEAGLTKEFYKGNFDAVCFNSKDEVYYFFRGDTLWKKPQGEAPKWVDYKKEFPQMDLALKGKHFDAAFFVARDDARSYYYFIRGSYYWTKEHGRSDVEGGVKGNFAGYVLKSDGVDYAIYDRSVDRLYLFYDDKSKILSNFHRGSNSSPWEGDEKNIKEEWQQGHRISGSLDKRCSAGVLNPGDNKYHFFRKQESLTKEKGNHGIQAPQSISTEWNN